MGGVCNLSLCLACWLLQGAVEPRLEPTAPSRPCGAGQQPLPSDDRGSRATWPAGWDAVPKQVLSEVTEGSRTGPWMLSRRPHDPTTPGRAHGHSADGPVTPGESAPTEDLLNPGHAAAANGGTCTRPKAWQTEPRTRMLQATCCWGGTARAIEEPASESAGHRVPEQEKGRATIGTTDREQKWEATRVYSPTALAELQDDPTGPRLGVGRAGSGLRTGPLASPRRSWALGPPLACFHGHVPFPPVLISLPPSPVIVCHSSVLTTRARCVLP